MIRDRVDVYVDGQLVQQNGSIAAQGGEIRITGTRPTRRFREAKLHRETTSTVSFVAVDPETGRGVGIAALTTQDCGCGKKT